MRLRFLAILLGLAVTLASCGSSARPIGSIIKSPRQYVGQTVTVSGQVVDVYTLRNVRQFTLADDSGQVTVITHKTLPARGERLDVTGRVIQRPGVGGTSRLFIKEYD